jgi:hypothetical protein
VAIQFKGPCQGWRSGAENYGIRCRFINFSVSTAKNTMDDNARLIIKSFEFNGSVLKMGFKKGTYMVVI